MKTKYLYILSALTLGLIGCSHEQQNIEMPHDNTMSFSVVSPNAHTRVSNGAFEAEDRIGVYVTDYVDDETPAPLQVSGNRANNEAVAFDGAEWRAERPIYWGEGKTDVYAYYPYIADISMVEEMPFSVATDQDVDGAYEVSDLLCAKATGVSQNDGAVALNMQHTMSRLVVRIMAGEDYVGSLPKDATVHLHSTVTDAHISLANGSVDKDPYAGAKSIKMRNLGIRSFADGEAVVYEAIVVPQMLEGSVPLLEINSKSVSYLLEDTFNFRPGVSYTYTAVLNTSTNAIKVEIGCDIEDWNNIGGDSGNEGDDGEGGSTEGGVDLSLYTDLSAEGTANCYLVQAAGNYKFKAVMGNSDYSVGNVKKTEVLWETFGTDVMPNVGDLIAETGYQNGYVYFTTAEEFKDGNASIAVRNSKDVILWSWHIWCAEEGWSDHVYANNAGTMMDRNLGATSATPGDIGAFGLMYQWGRKDPFMGSCAKFGSTLAASTGSWKVASSSDKMDFAEENPMTFATGWYGGSVPGNGWHTSDSAKGMYDPCPVGYRVPDGGNTGFWATALGTSSSTSAGTRWDSTNSGLHWTLADDETTAWYPAVGYRKDTSGVLIDVGSTGYYWSAFPIPSNTAYHMFFHSKVYPADSSNRSYGYSVRCVRE